MKLWLTFSKVIFIRTYYKIEGSIPFIWKGIYPRSFRVRPRRKFILLLLYWQINWCSLSYYCMDCLFFFGSICSSFRFFFFPILKNLFKFRTSQFTFLRESCKQGSAAIEPTTYFLHDELKPYYYRIHQGEAPRSTHERAYRPTGGGKNPGTTTIDTPSPIGNVRDCDTLTHWFTTDTHLIWHVRVCDTVLTIGLLCVENLLKVSMGVSKLAIPVCRLCEMTAAKS